MTLDAIELAGATQRLYTYILKQHWNGAAIVGPDPGIRLNARIGRFVKTYLGFIPWSDDLVYLQAQGYWVFDNWLMADLWDGQEYGDVARACSDYILAAQRPEGYWDYPNPEWKGRIATVEGCFAALGLLESYARLGHDPYLVGAQKWHDYMLDGIGFRRQEAEGQLAVNYFAHNSGDGGGVPNNSTMALWFLAKLAAASGDAQYLTLCEPMVAWLGSVQTEAGELPYAVGSAQGKDRPHFLCYQYNAFEFMDLVHYFQLTDDRAVLPILERLARFLSSGLTESSAARYDCSHAAPEVTYYTSAVAQALSQATVMGLGDYRRSADLAFERVLSQLAANGGSAFYSRKNYRVLSDRRSYPRYLAMILNHLLRESLMQKSTSQAQMPAVHSNAFHPNRNELAAETQVGDLAMMTKNMPVK